MTLADIDKLFTVSLPATLGPLAIHYFILFSPVMLAVILGFLFWTYWVRYVQLKQFLSLKYTILELKLPKDTFKSPLAMETVLHAIHNTSDGNVISQYWKGETRPWYSLEIISIEGQVKFLIWTEDRRKNNLISALYAQYPDIEVKEIEDYAKAVQFDPAKVKLWAAEFAFTKPDPYPIKTYVDYGLDRDPKEEFKVDPLTHIIEWLGSLRPNEQAWFQFIIRAHRKQKKSGHIWKMTDRYEDDARAEIDKLLMRDSKTKAPKTVKVVDGEEERAVKAVVSSGESATVEAIERSLSKLPFDVTIRAAYIAKKESFDTPFGIGGIISSMKQFNTQNLNGFRPNGEKWLAQFDYPWQDYKNTRRNKLSKKFFMAYRRRSAFYPPYKTKWLVLNTEELATIYHFPGSVSATPGLERVPSKKSQAPSNLPV